MMSLRRGLEGLTALLLAALVAACGDSGFTGGGFVVVGDDPAGGTWRTHVVSSGAAIPCPPPPALGSAAGQAEAAALLDRQAERTAAELELARRWQGGACTRWNALARGLVASHSTNPAAASRIYALLSIAQYDALVCCQNERYRHARSAPRDEIAGLQPAFDVTGPSYPADHAAAAQASRDLLAAAFPDAGASLDDLLEQHLDSRLAAGVNRESDLVEGRRIGEEVARQVLAHAADDGSADAARPVPIPTGDGYWYSSVDPPVPPLLPGWGNVRGWFITSGDQFRAPPPPAFGSAEFADGLAEVRRISDTRTPEQVRIALFWADGAGSATPPGHWNQIACDELSRRRYGELRAARTLALLNAAMLDAGICVWDSKYAYWLMRPSQADPAITTPPGLPNFPSYTSGHSGFSAAAAAVLGHLFPDLADEYQAMAEEAAISRVYGGIHYAFDSHAAVEQGRQVGALAVAWAAGDGAE